MALSVIACSTAAYFVEHKIVDALLRPAHGEHFIYTTAGGGIDFLFRICLYVGLVLSTPIIVYHLLKFMEPLMRGDARRFVAKISAACGVLALLGMGFGYFLGLPAAVHFLLHQFTTVQIQPLLTIQSYLSFVIAYLLGSALIFQLPLLLIALNRIKPLKPQQLFHYERWVILAAFVLGGIMNPSPNVMSQLVVAVPFILMYQVGIGIVALVNYRYPAHVVQLMAADKLQQAARQAVPGTVVASRALPAAAPATVKLGKPRLIDDFYRPVKPQPPTAPAHRKKPAQFMDFVPYRVAA